MRQPRYGPDNPDITYVPHRYEEHRIDLGEVQLNYACTGAPTLPALLLIPGQTSSWWSYEAVMPLLDRHFQVFAVDLRGQGRSSRTPGRYTWDNLGNDLVRFITFRIRRPTVVAGLSSGGVLAAWLSAYAPPGLLRGALYEDPPLFSSELTPACGPSLRQGNLQYFALLGRYLGDQWSIGDWEGLVAAAAASDLPASRTRVLTAAGMVPPQNFKEYDPEWGRACATGTISAGCDHQQMLHQVRCPVLLTHHTWAIDEATGHLVGAISGQQAQRVRELVTAAGQPIRYEVFPTMPHSMHRADPEQYARVLIDWASGLPSEDAVRRQGVFAND